MADQHWRFLDNDEIVTDFINNMSDEDRNSWKIPSTDLIGGHHYVGRYIRNYYRLWDEHNPHVGNQHPDDRSMDILVLIWKRLNPDAEFKGYH